MVNIVPLLSKLQPKWYSLSEDIWRQFEKGWKQPRHGCFFKTWSCFKKYCLVFVYDVKFLFLDHMCLYYANNLFLFLNLCFDLQMLVLVRMFSRKFVLSECKFLYCNPSSEKGVWMVIVSKHKMLNTRILSCPSLSLNRNW